MNFKLLAIIIYLCTTGFHAWMKYLEYHSLKNPIPENVKDVYDAKKYETWKSYHKESCYLGFWQFMISNVLLLILLCTDAFAVLTRFAGDNIYAAAIAVVVLDIVIEGIVGLVFDYIDTMKIEQKYEFNTMTKKTFAIDAVKGFIIQLIVMSGLTCLLAFLYETLGEWFLLLFVAVVFAVILFINFMSPVFVRIFNKLTPLEEGELRTKLEQMLKKNGYQVKQISVMDGSKRSTKANAFFGGFGKMKTIVLYDTLLEQLETDEIVAVFAHEMAHGKNRDTLKMTATSFLSICVMAVAIWAVAVNPSFSYDFGFTSVNYGFVLLIATTVLIPCVSPLMTYGSSALTRRCEYRADAKAVDEGYKDALSSALIKLSRNSLADLSPDDLLVNLTYSHPTLSQRLEAMEKEH